jgi:hypothetical protein
MFGIFSRLTAQEGDPPDEDQIGAADRPGAAAISAHDDLASSVRSMLIPAALLMMIVVVFTVILSGGSNCEPPDRAAVFAYQTAKVMACEHAQVSKAIATTSR